MEDCLIDKIPWIPVLRAGNADALPLRAALLESHQIDALDGELPTVNIALLRHAILPVVLHALGPLTKAAWDEMIIAPGFTDDQVRQLNDYLDERRHRFAAFHKEFPFGQTPDLEPAKKNGEKPSTALIPTMASGNNTPVRRRHTTDGNPLALPVGDAVRWMLHAQCWDTGGIKGGAVGDPQAKSSKTTGNRGGPLSNFAVVTPIGRNLYETIILNLPIGPRAAGDLPAWERVAPGPNWEERAPAGILEWWTWGARRMRLIPHQTDEGARVSYVVLAAGDRVAGVPPWEPHATWVYRKNTKKDKDDPDAPDVVRAPRFRQQGAQAWQGLETLLTLPKEEDAAFETSTLLAQAAASNTLGADYPLMLQTCSIIYNTHVTTIKDITFDTLPAPIAALRGDPQVWDTAVEAARQAAQLATATNRLAANLAQAASGPAPDPDRGNHPGDKLLSALRPYVLRFLKGCQTTTDPEQRARAHAALQTIYDREAQRAGNELLTRVPPSAFTGRTREVRGKPMTFRLAEAERYFNAARRKALPLIYPPRPEES
ncbi:type I-E CRISPR-associated protein Cse1/CasA [Streptomyces noursei]